MISRRRSKQRWEYLDIMYTLRVFTVGFFLFSITFNHKNQSLRKAPICLGHRVSRHTVHIMCHRSIALQISPRGSHTTVGLLFSALLWRSPSCQQLLKPRVGDFCQWNALFRVSGVESLRHLSVLGGAPVAPSPRARIIHEEQASILHPQGLCDGEKRKRKISYWLCPQGPLINK